MLDPTFYKPPDSKPAHASWWGSAIAWTCRVVVGATQLLVVSTALEAADLPACGPGPAPNRWPLLGPLLGGSIIASIAAWWFIGWLVRLDSTAAWLVALVGIAFGMIMLHIGLVMFMSLMTFC